MELQLHKNIISNSEVCSGRPTIKGIRITVKCVMEFVVAGDDDKSVLKSFPRLIKKNLKACKEFTTMLFVNPALINSFYP